MIFVVITLLGQRCYPRKILFVKRKLQRTASSWYWRIIYYWLLWHIPTLLKHASNRSSQTRCHIRNQYRSLTNSSFVLPLYDNIGTQAILRQEFILWSPSLWWSSPYALEDFLISFAVVLEAFRDVRDTNIESQYDAWPVKASGNSPERNETHIRLAE